MSNLTTSDHITWNAIFTPTAGVTDNTNHIRLLTSYTDIDGNAGKAASSENYTVKTVIDKLAETPTLAVSTTNTDAHHVKLNISSSLIDTDGSEKLVLLLKNIPTGVTVTGAHFVNGH